MFVYSGIVCQFPYSGLILVSHPLDHVAVVIAADQASVVIDCIELVLLFGLVPDASVKNDLVRRIRYAYLLCCIDQIVVL